MEIDFRETLENKRLELIAGLHLERTFLFDYLRTKSIFDGGDCELICAEKTREQKAGKFLDILSTKGEGGYRHFIDAIQLSNPLLFEQITGEKANMKPNPIMSLLKNGSIDNIPDLDIVTSHLQRAYTDLNDLTLSLQKMSQEKKFLEKNLIDAKSNVQALEIRVEELEKEKFETTSDVISSLSSVNSEKESAVQQMQNLHRDLQERNTYIIALHMHLLTAQEEIGNLKNHNLNAEEEKTKMHTELSRVTMNYDHQRHESIKLCEKLECHKNDLQKYNDLKMNFRELQFNHQKMKHERDEAVNELNSLKEWIEVFKARYDIVEKDSEQTRESHETLAADCYKLRQQIDELELKLGTQGRELQATKRRYSESIEEIKKLKEQRDILSESRKDLMLERDQALSQRDQSIQCYTEILKNRDETITKQTGHCKHYEETCETARAELQLLQAELASKEYEFEELRKANLERELSSEETSCSQLPIMEIPGLGQVLKTFDEELLASGESSPEESQDSEDSYNWKFRKTTNIIESLKKRLGKDRKDDQPTSPPTYLHLNGKNPDRILEELVPQKKTLSPEAQKCLSMERNNNIFKVAPTHSSLAYMFDSIAGGLCDKNLGSYAVSSSNPVSPPQNQNANYPRKALSDSDAKEMSKHLETKTKSETWHSAAAKRPPYYPTFSSPSERPRPVLMKSLTEPSPDSIFTFMPMSIPNEIENFDREKALMSPALRKPFRQRAMAIKLKERPRSRSAPPESPCEDER